MASTTSSPTQYRAIGLTLAIGSGLLIGTSFVFKKRGLLRSQQGGAAGVGVGYLKSPIWWMGMIMMIAGEICNFGAYAFVEAIVVTPMGALSVVISAVLSHYILKEKLTVFGWISCSQCILGAILIALNAPQEQTVTTIDAFKKLFLGPGFLAYGSVCIVSALVIAIFIAPKYGKQQMIWHILVCSVIGGISVSCTSGLGACILTTIRGDNQFDNWFIYFLIVFVACTLVTEIYFLNVALALHNTAMVTPTYYVFFTFFTLVSSVILYQGLKASIATILTIVFSFLVICSGVVILQMSRIDPKTMSKLDRKTTILLQACREEIKPQNDHGDEDNLLESTEEPGMDALAGRFSGIGATFVRARRRTTLFQNQILARKGHGHKRPGSASSAPCPAVPRPSMASLGTNASAGMNSLHARQLHRMWREELEEGRTDGSGDDGTTFDMMMASRVVGDPEKGEFEHITFSPGRIDMPHRPDDMEFGRMLSEGDMVVSPAASAELRSTASVHFHADPSQSQPASGSGSEATADGSVGRPTSSYSNSQSALLVLTGGRGRAVHRSPNPKSPKPRPEDKDRPNKLLKLPNMPKPALTPSGTTSGTLLNLNLPTPSLHLPHFLTRRTRSQVGRDGGAAGAGAGRDEDVIVEDEKRVGEEREKERDGGT